MQKSLFQVIPIIPIKEKICMVTILNKRNPHGVVVKVLDCDNVISEFKLQSCYYIYFWTNAHWKFFLTNKQNKQRFDFYDLSTIVI